MFIASCSNIPTQNQNKSNIKLNFDLQTSNKNKAIIIESLLEENIEILKNRFDDLFDGKFENTIEPDEWNWKKNLSDSSTLSGTLGVTTDYWKIINSLSDSATTSESFIASSELTIAY